MNQDTVWAWLERAAGLWPDKPAYQKETADGTQALTFAQLYRGAKRIAGMLPEAAEGEPPALVLCDKSLATLALYWGVIASGRAYAPLDPALPEERIRRIAASVSPALIVSDVSLAEKAAALREAGALPKDVCVVDALAAAASDAPEPADRAYGIEGAQDALYCVFTSGSSGTPKGVLTAQASLVNYIEGYGAMMEIGPDDVLGNQSPLDYIAAIRDIYLPVRFGCSSVLLDKTLFMQPANLFAAMERQGVTAIGWSASALSVIASMNGLLEGGPAGLKKVCFSGSVMPAAVLMQWQKACPGTRFVNQYGPTEATASCTYYEVDHAVAEGEELPIGRPYPGYEVFLLGDDATEAAPGERAEICVGGVGVTMGYLADPERTAQAFGERIRPDGTRERIYHTGDIGWQDPDGLFHYCGRKDRQIKHMGHRVEPEEIETAAVSVDGVSQAAVLYDEPAEQLVLFYTGDASVKDVAKGLRKILPGFMVPRKLHNLPELPALSNGKTDYKALAESIR